MKLLAVCGFGLFAPVTLAQNDVIVALDMNGARPGIQNLVQVPPGTTRVPDIGVYIYDPSGRHHFDSIGYIGGIDRGIGLGHTPTGQHAGSVLSMHTTAINPLDPQGTAWVIEEGFLDPGFAGPEVQYLEYTSGNIRFPAAPIVPVFTVEVELDDAKEGDSYNFYVVDFVTVWRMGTGGAFTVDGGFLLTGGDVVPDTTLTMHGVDPDRPQPVPPGAFFVDFVDGPPGGGPGVIVVASPCYADCDSSTGPGVLDIFDFLCFQNRFAAGAPYACDCDTTTGLGTCDVFDFLCFQNQFAAGCP
jgi:hypothetical protein